MSQLYDETCIKIKSLEIQGAEKIAVAGVRAFAEKLADPACRSLGEGRAGEQFLNAAIAELSSLRETEPALRNALRFCMLNRANPNVAEEVVAYFEKSKAKIAAIGAQKIHDGMTVFTHCHASTVTAILLKAWSDGKRFTVRNTETRPKFQGRKTAEELAAAGIPVIHSVDSSARLQLKQSDLFLFGADAVTVEGNVVNKIGTTMFAEFAHDFGIPVYSCTNSWKFDPATIGGADEPIEYRDTKEVWENPPANVSIINPAFELTSSDRIMGIITELGVFKPEALVGEIQRNYPWMTE